MVKKLKMSKELRKKIDTQPINYTTDYRKKQKQNVIRYFLLITYFPLVLFLVGCFVTRPLHNFYRRVKYDINDSLRSR